MIKAQIRVDIGCRDLTSRNRIDNGRRSCYAVSARVGTEDIVYDAVFLGLNIAAEYRNPKLFKEVDISSLSDGRNDDIARNLFLRLGGIHRTRSAALIGLSRDLRFHPKRLHFPAFVGRDSGRCLELYECAAFGDRAADLIRQCRHIVLSSSVNNAHLGRTQTFCRSGYVHRNIAAADDHDNLAVEIRHR